jgi:hypothetical protein
MRGTCDLDAVSPRNFKASAPGGVFLHRVPQTTKCGLPCCHQVSFYEDLRVVNYTQAVSGDGQERQPPLFCLLDQYNVEVARNDGLLGLSLIHSEEELECV